MNGLANALGNVFGFGASRAERDFEQHKKDMAEAARIAWDRRTIFTIDLNVFSAGTPRREYRDDFGRVVKAWVREGE